MICGAVIIIASVLVPEQGRVVLFGAMMATILATLIYSYFAWRTDSQRTQRGGVQS